MHGDAEVADHPAQQGAAGLVELLGHQARRHLDDVGRHTEGPQRIRRFQTEQAAADHDTGIGVPGGQGPLGVGVDRVEVVEGAVDVAAGQVAARDRGDKR